MIEELDDLCFFICVSGVGSQTQHSFGFLGFLSGFGDLSNRRGLFLHSFNHSHCNGLTHVTHSKTTCKPKKNLSRSSVFIISIILTLIVKSLLAFHIFNRKCWEEMEICNLFVKICFLNACLFVFFK